MRTVMVAVMVAMAAAGCAGDEPSPCETDIAALYERGCSFARPDGSHVEQDVLVTVCNAHVAKAGPTCTSHVRGFAACLGGGASVVCE